MTTEIWRPVVGFEGNYSVSDHGRVRSEFRSVTYMGRFGLTTRSYPQKILATRLDTAGYPCVALSENSKVIGLRIHRLMLEAFVGPRPEKAHARHLDDIKSNNVLSNLMWGTPLENSQDKYRNGSGNQHLNKTHCKNGHELSGENLYLSQLPRRVCITCNRARANSHEGRL